MNNNQKSIPDMIVQLIDESMKYQNEQAEKKNNALKEKANRQKQEIDNFTNYCNSIIERYKTLLESIYESDENEDIISENIEKILNTLDADIQMRYYSNNSIEQGLVQNLLYFQTQFKGYLQDLNRSLLLRNPNLKYVKDSKKIYKEFNKPAISQNQWVALLHALHKLNITSKNISKDNLGIAGHILSSYSFNTLRQDLSKYPSEQKFWLTDQQRSELKAILINLSEEI